MFSTRLSVDYIPGPPMPMTSWSTTASQKRVPVQVQEKLLYTVQQGNKCQSWVPASWFALTCHRVIHAKAKKPTQHAMSEFFFLMTPCRVTWQIKVGNFRHLRGRGVPLSLCLPVPQSPCHTATLSPCHTVSHLSVSLSPCHPATLPHCLPSVCLNVSLSPVSHLRAPVSRPVFLRSLLPPPDRQDGWYCH